MTCVRMMSTALIGCVTMLWAGLWLSTPAFAQVLERGVEGGAVGAIIGGIVGGGGAGTGAAIGAGVGVLSGAAEAEANARARALLRSAASTAPRSGEHGLWYPIVTQPPWIRRRATRRRDGSAHGRSDQPISIRQPTTGGRYSHRPSCSIT